MSSNQKDTIYRGQQPANPFKFDEKVAAVFPDMIQRSVPGYDNIIHGIQQLAKKFVAANTHCYDLGCSLGAASLAMSQGIEKENCQVIAIDNSEAMIKRCELFVESYHHETPITVACADISDQKIENASMVVLNFTLQFIELEKRQVIIDRIYQGLNPGGVLVLSEKILSPDNLFNQLLIDLHHDFKRANGYSELEISQKRNALENVLVPETIDDHIKRLKQSGFKSADIWQQQFNFCSFIAIK
ncbi:carboxy-S-adenosyl-L-methionine synthase CmoA [Pleionea sediminis]|uniref:carboxy-S-adenosyl-L-methionine synthase CmoA n=1 Tax=Pleionea sediminis TaxID=2569479 RepID=UPI0011866EC1|nr:carboxy-S-adenosyl-L-methionine synthase CmoA [Pleionea sediminis]